MKKINFWLFTSLSVAALALGACSSSSSDSGEDPAPAPSPTPGEKTDFEAPSIFIQTPTSDDAFVTIDGGLTIGGTAQDNKGLASVSYSTSRGAEGVAAGLENWSISGLNLPEGDTNIEVKATDMDGNNGEASITITKNKYLTFLGLPKHDKEMVYTNSNSQVWITTQIVPNSNLIANSMKLIEVDANGNQVGNPICQLFDDGDLTNHGDEIKGDNVFSAKAMFNFTSDGKRNLRIVAETNETEGAVKGYSAKFVIDVVDQGVVTQQVANLQSTQASVQAAMATLPENTEEAAQQLTTLLQQDANVKEVSNEGDVLKVTHTSGIESYIVLNEDANMKGFGGDKRAKAPSVPLSKQTRGICVPSYRNNIFSTRASAVNPAEIIQNKDVLIWSAFSDKYTESMATALKDVFASSPVKLNVTVMENTECTAGSLSKFLNYGVIVIDTHGLNGNLMFTREAISTSGTLSEEELYNLYTNKIKMVTMKNGTFAALTPEFIKSVLSIELPNTVVFNGSCESMKNDNIANAFISRGAKTYVGFSGKVSVQNCNAKAREFFSALVGADLKTTGESFIQDTFTESDGSVCSYLMRGNSNMHFYMGLINGDFEYGKIGGWSVDGDGRVITSLGSYLPTQGQYMGIVSTGLGYTTNYGCIHQTFRVGTNETKLLLKWNYFSEEFLEWIGSNYQDYLKITIEDEQGVKHVLLYKAIDNFAADFGAAKGVQGNLLYVSPEIVFDRGGVFATGWQSMVLDISAFQGQTVTLYIESGDVGDSIFDSAVLLDEIAVE